MSQTITTHMLPYMSGPNGNEAMKFGQLIEYNKRIVIFIALNLAYN